MSTGPLHDGLVGRRVTVRSQVPGERGPTGRPAMTDVVGRVRSVTTDGAEVERRDGSIVAVPTAHVLSVTIVPDVPRRSRSPRATSPEDLTRIGTRGWPPVETEPLGDWLLRAAGGFTGRANSAAVHGDPGRPAADALEAVVSFYERRRLPPRAQVVVGSAWEAVLDEAGWGSLPGARGGAIVLVGALADAAADRPPTVPGVDMSVSDVLDEAWMAGYPRTYGIEPDVVRTVLAGPPATGFVRATGGDGTLVAVGRVAVTGEWAGLAAVEVRPQDRRRGLGRLVVDRALAWAAEQGADKVYLQTMHDNTAALGLYAGLEFTRHHEYRYLSPPGAG